MKNQMTAIAVLVALTGCAQPYALPALAPGHPASTAASEAPAPPRSVALEAEPVPQSTKEDSAEGGGQGMQGMHGGH